MPLEEYTKLVNELKNKVLIDDVSRWKFRVTKRLLGKKEYALYASIMTGIDEIR